MPDRELAPQPAPTMGTMPQGPSRPATAEVAANSRWKPYVSSRARVSSLRCRDRDTAQVLGHLQTTARSALTTIANDAGSGPTADRVRAAYSAAVRTVLVRERSRSPTRFTRHRLCSGYTNSMMQRPAVRTPRPGGHRRRRLSAELSADLPRHATRAQRTRHAAIQAARPPDARDHIPSRNTDRRSVLHPRWRNNYPAPGRNVRAPVEHDPSHAVPRPAKPGCVTDGRAPGGQHDGHAGAGPHAVWRQLRCLPFQRLDLGGLGTEILIERQGEIGIEGLTMEQRHRATRTLDRVGFHRGGGFSQDEFDQVLMGLNEIPEAQLCAGRAALRAGFRRSGTSRCRGALRPIDAHGPRVLTAPRGWRDAPGPRRTHATVRRSCSGARGGPCAGPKLAALGRRGDSRGG